MAFGVRASSTATAATGTAVAVAAPTGTVAGDLVLVFIHANNETQLIGDNNGATPFTEDVAEHGNALGGAAVMSVFRRRILPGDPSTYNFTISESTRWTATAIAIRDPHPGIIYNAAITKNFSSTDVTTANAPDITFTARGALHIAALGVDGTSNVATATPAGYTVHENSGQEAICLVSKIVGAPGAVGPQSFSWTTATTNMAISIAVHPGSVKMPIKTGGNLVFV